MNVCSSSEALTSEVLIQTDEFEFLHGSELICTQVTWST